MCRQILADARENCPKAFFHHRQLRLGFAPVVVGSRCFFLVLPLLVVLRIPGADASCPYLQQQRQQQAKQDDEWLGQIPHATDTSDPLVVLNNAFHAEYAKCGKMMRPPSHIILEGDYLVLMEHDQRSDVKSAIPPVYHDLKMLSHLSLAIYTILLPEAAKSSGGGSSSSSSSSDGITQINSGGSTGNPGENDQLSPEGRSALQSYTDGIRRLAIDDFAAAQLPSRLATVGNCRKCELQGTAAVSEAVADAEAVIAACIDFGDKVLLAGRVTESELVAFARVTTPALSRNLDRAAAAQIDAMHSVLSAWTSGSPETAPTVVASAPHMAMRNALVTQFFGRLFGVDTHHNDRVFTLENPTGEDYATKLLDTHVTDYAIGHGFFGNKYQMHEDALAQGAATYLDRLFPPAEAASSVQQYTGSSSGLALVGAGVIGAAIGIAAMLLIILFTGALSKRLPQSEARATEFASVRRQSDVTASTGETV